MQITHLELEEFRSYRALRLSLAPVGLRLFGANASGKSTLLEAVAMLATTRSPRSTTDRDVINWRSGADVGFPPYARLLGHIERQDGPVDLEITLQADPSRPTVVKKQIKIGGRAVRAMDAVGRLKAVIFAPDDIELVTGSPAQRRRYLDLTISQVDGRYLRALSRYGRILSQRNSLLKALSRDRVSPDSPLAVTQLAYWDDELVTYGAYVIARRRLIVRELASLAHRRFTWLSGGDLTVEYQPSLPLADMVGPNDGNLEQFQAVVARDYRERLTAERGDEIRRGVSLVGPHRDDIGFTIDGVDVATYGSRGQQRLVVVALKLAETDLLQKIAGEPPVLLLDDALSELDARHRSLLIGSVATMNAQLLVTAADRALLEAPEFAHIPEARVSAGEIIPVDHDQHS